MRGEQTDELALLRSHFLGSVAFFGALWFSPGVSGFLIKQNLFLVTHDASAKHRTDLGPFRLEDVLSLVQDKQLR